MSKNIRPNSPRSYQIVKLVFIGLIILPLNALWVIDTGIAGHGINFTRVSIFMNSVFAIFVLSLINPLIRKISPKLALNKSDLILFYVMMNVSSAIAGHDMIQRLFPLIGHAFHFATPENDWAELFYHYVPRWWVVDDPFVLAGYYKDQGMMHYETFYVSEYVRAWIVPCLAWSSVAISLIVCMLCINLLIREHWSERERLTYPLAQIPLEIIDIGPKLFRSKLIWIGFAIAVLHSTINGIHYLFPAMPSIFYGRFTLSKYFTVKPWNALGWVPIEFHPFVIGLAIFMPLDLAFSCWFFYWFWRLGRVFGRAFLGGGTLAGFPFAWQQAIGACFGILAMTLWGTRSTFWQIGKNLISRDGRRDRLWAVIGIFLSLSYLIGFCHVAGMQIWVATIFFLIFFGLSLVVTRIRAEVGYPMHDFAFRPEGIMVTAIGTRPIGPASLTLFSYLHFFTYAHRSNPQPHILEAFRISDRISLKIDRYLITGILIAIVIGSISACWAYLHTAYHYRGGTWPGHRIFTRLQNWLIYPREINLKSLTFMAIGTGMGIGMLVLRRLFLWWPFHPAGFVIGTTWSLNLLWFSIFISWAIKFLILKFGSVKIYRKATAFFIGLVLGEFVMAGFWGAIGVILGQDTYRFI